MKELKEKILIVDDDTEVTQMIVDFLSGHGYGCVSANSGNEALKVMRENQVFLLITDFKMPVMNGIALIKAIRESKPLLPTILITGFAERQLLVEAVRTGVNEFMDKPLDMVELEAKVRTLAEARLAEVHRDAQELEDLKRVFVEESKSILGDLDPLLTGLEEGAINTEDINVIYRKVHTLKGSAGSLPGSASLVRLAHSLETVLSGLKDRQIAMTSQMLTTMLTSLELLGVCVLAIDTNAELPDTTVLQSALGAYSAGQPATVPAASMQGTAQASRAAVNGSPKKTESSEDGVMVSSERLETLKDVAGELVAFKNTFDVFLKQYGESLGVHVRELMEMDRTLFKITDQIQQQISDMQQVNFGKAFAKFPRVVRQVAGELGKQIKLSVVGAEMNIDRTVSRALTDALIHAVRNSCDHGVEKPEKRTTAGKLAEGNIIIKGAQSADTITVEVHDDGAGLNRERIAKKAVERGILTEDQVKNANDGEIWDLLFLPNFSTAEKISDISGRGVGMDVVKTAAKKLGGTAWFETVAGKGTVLTMQFPVPKSLVVEPSVVARAGDLTLIVPLSSISEIRHVEDTEMTYVAPHWTFQNRGVTVPAGTYQFILDDEGLPRSERNAASLKRSGLVAVLHHRGRSVGVFLDEIVDQLEAVIRPFDEVIGRISGFRGVSRLPNEVVGYVLSAEDAVKNVLDSNRAVVKAVS